MTKLPVMKTKMIATIGPASRQKEVLAQLIDAGVRIFRLNFSHGDAASFAEIIHTLRELENQRGVPLTLMQDLSGPKIRLGNLKDEQPIEVQKGTRLLLGPDSMFSDEYPFLPFDHKEVLSEMEEGDHLVLADGSMFLRVVEKRAGNLFVIEAENAGYITSRKGLTLPGKSIPVPALTEKDKINLVEGLAMGVDAVALSYVQTPDDIREAKAIIQQQGFSVPVVAKLERRNAVERLDAILSEADIIMVARGDLGVECSLAEVPAMQKRIIRACNEAAKPVIVATQMLVSMVSNPSPTRAETTDVANAVWDGADCVMLSEETAMGAYPVEAVTYMREIATQAEAVMEERHGLPAACEQGCVSEFFAYSACLLAEKARARGIVVHTQRGASARMISALKPHCPVFAVTSDKSVLRALNFSWGIRPRQLAMIGEEDHLSRVERFINASSHFAPGDHVVITASSSQGTATDFRTDLVKIYRK